MGGTLLFIERKGLKEVKTTGTKNSLMTGTRELVNIVARKYVFLEKAHVQPYRSSDHNIFSVHTLSAPTFFRYPSQVFCKMMALPLNPTPPISFENEELRWYLVPLLHTSDNFN